MEIFKFRTMVQNADKMGSLVTINNDTRVTKIGKSLRKYRLDEIPQLLNILTGDMTFVGTRPEVPKYVAHYTDEMKATLLLPAGVTSRTSILHKNEEYLISSDTNVEKVYIELILPRKMKYNLQAIKSFSFCGEIATLLQTISAVL